MITIIVFEIISHFDAYDDEQETEAVKAFQEQRGVTVPLGIYIFV